MRTRRTGCGIAFDALIWWGRTDATRIIDAAVCDSPAQSYLSGPE